jgi:excisionase family DNA binding protein
MDVTVQEAAAVLGVSPRRVRSLIAQGEIPARRSGSRVLLVDIDAARRARRGPRREGRPLSERSAWALLRLAEGQTPVGRSASEMARDLRRLETLEDIDPGALSSRAKVHRFGAHPGVLTRLEADGQLVRGGASAAGHHHADLIALKQVEAYVKAEHLPEIESRYALWEVNVRENVLLRIASAWPFEPGLRVAPGSVVAADLIDAGDERSVRAGRDLMRRVLSELTAR